MERKLPAIRFSHGEWMARLYGDDPPVDQFQEFHDRVSKLIETHWTRCVELGLDVVLDLGFWSRTQRSQTRATAVALGASDLSFRVSGRRSLATCRAAQPLSRRQPAYRPTHLRRSQEPV
ncbi:AAA family ATPase [Bradyrhizobium sp. DASA03076]|uniref:AAA family ATPase n=1 Tax=Bradyrhizobium sp. BLXBL-03 TaxID=3395916 RepID=UPI003F718B63